MDRKRIPTLLAGVGGLLILLGALVAFLLGMVNGISSHSVAAASTLVSTAVVAGVIGVIALVMTYYARGSDTERLVGGIGLLVLGAVSWAFLMSSALALAGSILVFFGGLVFAVEELIPSAKQAVHSTLG